MSEAPLYCLEDRGLDFSSPPEKTLNPQPGRAGSTPHGTAAGVPHRRVLPVMLDRPILPVLLKRPLTSGRTGGTLHGAAASVPHLRVGSGLARDYDRPVGRAQACGTDPSSSSLLL